MTEPDAVRTAGIDLLVTGAPEGAIRPALANALGLAADDIIGPGDDIMDRLGVLGRPLRATILPLQGGDFTFKVDLDGSEQKRDYAALARRFGAALGHDVVMLDETAANPAASIRIRHGEPDLAGWLEDAEPDGCWFRTAAAPR